MTDDIWTVGRLLTWTTGYLKQQGGESPRLDAEVLLAHARQTERISLYTSFDEVVDEIVRGRFRELVKRRAAGCPVAYLVGHREFYSLSFEVTPDVLIPRPETEFLVMSALDWAKAQDPDRAWRVLEVGTGSGVIAVCLAKYLPQAQIVATDISAAALQIARRNAQRHNVVDRIQFVEQDLATADHLANCDMLVSNPPDVAQAEAAGLTREVRDHEPHTALFGGQRGDEITGRLLELANAHLPQVAPVFIEMNANLCEEMLALGRGFERFSSVKILNDLAGMPRILQAS
jgi:release factor glutamine methyltransferase